MLRTVLRDKQIAWIVTRYDDVLTVLKDERFGKDKRKALSSEQLARLPWTPSVFKPLEQNMLDLDPPDHTRLRGLVHQVFTPRLIENMRERRAGANRRAPRSRRIAGPDGPDPRFCAPLPATIIAEILGVPGETGTSFTAGRTRCSRPNRLTGANCVLSRMCWR